MSISKGSRDWPAAEATEIVIVGFFLCISQNVGAKAATRLLGDPCQDYFHRWQSMSVSNCFRGWPASEATEVVIVGFLLFPGQDVGAVAATCVL